MRPCAPLAGRVAVIVQPWFFLFLCVFVHFAFIFVLLAYFGIRGNV